MYTPEPWREKSYYTTGKVGKCLNCKKECHQSPWGYWCYDCNVERIERVNKSFEDILKGYNIGTR